MNRRFVSGLTVIIALGAATACGQGQGQHSPLTAARRPVASPSPPAPPGTKQRAVLSGPLPAGPARATAWTLPAGPADSASVLRLARALGISGTPRRRGSGWEVSGPGTLQVTGEPGLRWSFFFVKGAPTGAPPDEPAALATAARLARASGTRTGPFTATLHGPQVTLVADDSLDGLPTAGWQTQLTVAGGAIIAGAGWLARPRRDSDYPAMSARDTFEALLTAVGRRPLPGRARCPQVEQEACPPGRRPVISVTGARFGLSLAYWRNQPVLAPSWLFSTAQGAVLPQVAVPAADLPPSPP
ncbi:MAG: hypothetical protein JWL58_330 [Streptosporangiaceae bacterium]|jgi:hypothetical protein|nr:hypothetical protein [Streptosporangiaceae bacterium]